MSEDFTPSARPPILLGSGRVSFFGGPADTGVTSSEGLGLIEDSDLHDEWFARLFHTPMNPALGLARNLNPNEFYCAMRFAYGQVDGVQGEILPEFTREQIRRGTFIVSSVKDPELCISCQAADWGPNISTGRLIDVSPGVMRVLQLETDDQVTVEFWG